MSSVDVRIIKVGEGELLFNATSLAETLKSLSDDVDIDSVVNAVREASGSDKAIFFAMVNTEVLGVASLIVHDTMLHVNGVAGIIEEVAVHRNWQGHGIGSALIERFLEEAKLFGCYKVTLSCEDKNVEFYEKLGFFKHEVFMRHNLNGN